MNDNYIRNREGKIIGRTDGDWLRDGTGKYVARYDKWDDRTRTREGKIVGTETSGSGNWCSQTDIFYLKTNETQC